MANDPQPSHAQREALRIFAETLPCRFEWTTIEAELAKLDEAIEPAVRNELQRLFDAMVNLESGEVREPVPGFTVSLEN
jgi:hypothetical protein